MNGCDRLLTMARFLSYVTELDGCMIWNGGRSQGGRGRAGRCARGGPYGSFWIDRQWGSARAHIVWAWLSGVIPEPRVPAGHHLDHECHSGTLCVCCTNLKPVDEHRAMPRTARHKADRRAEAIAAADRARINRLARRRDARAAG